jgi:hypothetical protein
MALRGAAKQAYRKDVYDQRKADGLCPHCGERPPYEERVSCLPCRKRFRVYSQRYTGKQREIRRQGIEILRCPCRKRAMVLCIVCQAPLCDTCYDLGEGCCRECTEDAPLPPTPRAAVHALPPRRRASRAKY